MRKIVLSLIVMLLAAFSAKALVYTVVVPEGTKACYIAGNMNGWSQQEMEQDPDEPTIFTIDLPDAVKEDGYKYCCGPGWAWVEKGADGEEIRDRTYPDDGMNIDFVLTWALEYDPDFEGDFTFNVTVPEETKAVYIKGSYNNWSGYEPMTKVTETTYTLTVHVVGSKSVNYVYACGPDDAYQEVDDEGNTLLPDRNLAEPESDDVVLYWKGIYDPDSMFEYTLNVTVPEGTIMCFVAGNMNGWKQQAMEKVDETTFTLSFSVEGLDEIAYKYCNGPSWDYVEIQEDGNDLADNRILSVDDSPADDVVAAWKKDFEPVFILNVTVPEGTNACYVAGSMNGWDQEEMEKVDDTTYTITFNVVMAEIQYKYCSGPHWDYVEVQEDGSDLDDNRKLAIGDSPVDDVVVAWNKVYASLVNVSVDNPFIITGKSTLTTKFTGIAKVEIFTVNGVLLHKTIANGEFTQSDLAAGVYVVKINNKAFKALVK